MLAASDSSKYRCCVNRVTPCQRLQFRDLLLHASYPIAFLLTHCLLAMALSIALSSIPTIGSRPCDPPLREGIKQVASCPIRFNSCKSYGFATCSARLALIAFRTIHFLYVIPSALPGGARSSWRERRPSPCSSFYPTLPLLCSFCFFLWGIRHAVYIKREW